MSLQTLSSRLDAVLDRLAKLELAAGVTPADALAHRQLSILDRLATLEAACGLAAAVTVAAPLAAVSAASRPASSPSDVPEVAGVDRSGSEVQQRLQAELLERGLTRHKFVRAPPEYYDRPLEFRWAADVCDYGMWMGRGCARDRSSALWISGEQLAGLCSPVAQCAAHDLSARHASTHAACPLISPPAHLPTCLQAGHCGCCEHPPPVQEHCDGEHKGTSLW